MKPEAIILTHGLLDTVYAKTCHGLLRATKRYNIVAVIDQKFAGQKTSSLVDGVKDIPIYRSVDVFIASQGLPEWCIVGVAFEGGIMPDEFRTELMSAAKSGVSVVNGLHTLLRNDHQFMQVAGDSGVEVIDIRRPKPLDDLEFWTGKILDVQASKLAVLGTDCAVGKRTTCNKLLSALKEQEVQTEMIYTGQTGWLEGHQYGCILDATLNDFVSGELESAVYQCDMDMEPDLILVEGQSALRNPTGPCGAELIISLQCRHVVLQHDPNRKYFDNDEDLGLEIPSLQSEIELIRLLGAEVIAIVVKPDDDVDEDVKPPVLVADKAGMRQLAEIVMDTFEL